METLTLGETITAMFQLGMLVALWGIYTEVRNSVGNPSERK